MYDVRRALQRFRGLIKYTARKYAVRGHFRMAAEDIEAEGYLTLVQCCRSFPTGQRRFGRYFKRAWNNRLKKLTRFGLQVKRQGFEVDLELAFEIPEPSSESWDRIKTRVYEITPLLGADTRRFLEQLLEPSQEVAEYAWRDFCRKNRLHHVQGAHVPGWRCFRVKMRHIRGALHLSPAQAQRMLNEIRIANRTTQLRRRLQNEG